jgi:hypothetical protein
MGVNFADILARKALYSDAPKPPCVVGYEVSGVIESVIYIQDSGYNFTGMPGIAS